MKELLSFEWVVCSLVERKDQVCSFNKARNQYGCLETGLRPVFVLSGLFFVVPCIDSYKAVDLRVVSFDVPPQEVRKELLSTKLN